MKKRRGLADRGRSRRLRHQNVPGLERVEDRILMATFVVTSATDALNAQANDGTLRGEILASNATTTANTITFSISGSTQKPAIITVKGPLPAITTALTIDGTTAGGFVNSPVVEISGLNPAFTSAGPGLAVNAAASTIKDLIIDNFAGDGIDLNAPNCTVAGCYIGIDSTGTTLASNTNDGILVASANNTIGGLFASNPNVITGNGANQIEINGVNAGQNVVSGNYVGTNAAGTAAVPTSPASDGILVESSNNIIGDGSLGFGGLGQGNLISGNFDGLLFYPGANNNTAQGNYIGTDITGLLSVGNSDFGVYINGGTRNTIGGTFDGGNVISGNALDGVRIQGSGSTGNAVEGNDIGIGADGTTAVGNGNWGVQINGANNNVVGNSTLDGDDDSAENFIQNNNTVKGAYGGVTVVNATGDGILSNSIYNNNGGPGITIPSSNQGVKAPTLTTVQSGAGETEISGTYTGTPGTMYRIQFFSSIAANPSGIGDGQNYLLGDITVTPNSVGTATFNTILSPEVPVGYFVTATATQGILVTNNTSAFSTAVQTIQAAVSDLSVTTTVGATAPQLDQPYTYTLTVSNAGPNDSSAVTLTDTLPKNAVVISVSGGTVAAGVLTDNLGILTTGATDTITIVLKPTTTGVFTNTAVVTGPNLDSNLANNTSTTTSNVVPDADLSVTLTPNITLAPVGSPIIYTLSINNNGPSVATGTITTIQLPLDFTNIIVTPDQGSYTISQTNLVTINTGILPASSASIVTIQATPTTVETAITLAAVSAPLVSDPNPANNTTSAVVNVGNAADLALTLTASPTPVLVGQQLIYTIVVTNNGPSAASEPVVVDPLPAGLVYDDSGSSATNGVISFANGYVIASLNALQAGDSDTITIATTTTTTGLVSNLALVGDPVVTSPIEIDPDLSNNIATLTVPVSPADLSVSVINPTDPLMLGNLSLFEIQVQNSGPATATNVTLSDTFANAVIGAVSVGQSFGGNYLADLGSLAAGQTFTVFISVLPVQSGTLTDTASVSSDDYDPDPSNNSSSSSNLVSPVDIGVTLAGPTGPILLGQPLIYIATITNYGPSPATNVLFGDTLPADSYFGALVASQGTVVPNGFYNQVSGDLGTLAAGQSATVTIYVNPTVAEALTTNAAVSSDNFDTNPANNTASYGVSIVNLPGTIAFNSTLEAVNENAGSITLLVDRTGGTLGTVTANYFTENYTAVAGVNYTATVGTVTFLPGQSFATITIPILDDGIVDGNSGFFVGLTAPTGGASIGTAAATGIIVVNTDRDLIPPIVSSLLALPNGNQIDGFAITFDKAMDPTRASLVSNYYVFLLPVGGSNIGTQVPLAAAEYNAANNTVILVPTAPLPANRFYEIVANGSFGTALTDVSGNLLYGSSGPNTNYIAFYGQGTQLVYNDAQNNQVTLNLSGGGIMGVYLASNGEAQSINLYGIVPHSTKLSGSVKKLSKTASGHTNIGAINGLGSFGQVNSTLTTPGFYVGSAVVTASSVGASTPVSLTVSAESVTTPAVAVKKATPKGPKHSKH